jgi:metal-dependent amidase/aminoacylase/carboxypeptidase family protein
MAESHKDDIRESIYANREALVGLAHDIHVHPEIAYCEEYSAARLAEFLEREGFEVERGICGLPTAFQANVGRGRLHLAFCAEYDALPPASLFDRSKPTSELTEVWLDDALRGEPLRHACGHNLIAGSSIGAALGLRDLVDELDLTVSVFGTPAEELFGLPEPTDGRLAPGKDALLEAGAFAGVHAALMIHPFPTPCCCILPTINYARIRAQFSKADGATAFDRHGLRMLLEELKRTVQSSEQTPALFVARPEEAGAGALADFSWVAPTLADSLPVRDAVRRCFMQAAAKANVSVEVAEYARDKEMRHDPVLSAAYRENAKALGSARERDGRVQTQIRSYLPPIARPIQRVFPGLFTPAGLFFDRFPKKVECGTDLSNLSHAIPAIQPYVGIGPLVIPHSVEFAEAADSEDAYTAMLQAAVALAWTGVDAASDSKTRSYVMEGIAD